MRSFLAGMRLTPRTEDLRQRHTAHRRDVGRTAQPLEGVHGRLHEIVRIARAQTLGEHVLDPGALEHRTHAGTGVIELPRVTGTRNIVFFADSPALRIASATSLALPSPTPTCPLPSPIATMALNEKRRPPFTTFAQRLTLITRSANSDFGPSGVRATLLPPRIPDRRRVRRRRAL